MDNEEAGTFLSAHEDPVSKEEMIEEMMDTYGRKVARLAYTYVKDYGKAEDIAQEVFIKCFTKLDQFRGKAALKTWIYRVTVNLCKDELKSWHTRNMTLTDRIADILKNTVASPELFVIERDAAQHIEDAVLTLPIKYREVIILFYYEDFSVAEISRLTGIRKATVKTRIRRARILLEKMLANGKGTDRDEK
ncbi:MAG TPA: sigma-70 family RNA polymerase sigma factor [Bacillales bacterium]